MYVVSDSTLLHVPFPMADTALMRTSYTVPASRASRRVDVVELEVTGLVVLQPVLRFLYSTWYSEMVTSLWGVVQVTPRAGFPECIALDTATTVTWDGTIKTNKGITLQIHTLNFTGINIRQKKLPLMELAIVCLHSNCSTVTTIQSSANCINSCHINSVDSTKI